jgi:arylsulfatase A-like enzyme
MAESDEPFFVWSSQVAPHDTCGHSTGEFHCGKPPVPAARHRNLFKHATSPSLRNPSFNERNVKDKPRAIRKLHKVKPSKINSLFRQRIRSLQAVDEAVRSTVDTLRDVGELDNTLIVFTTDNGYLLGEHRYVRKDVPYEPALRTPLLVRGPGVPAGVTRSQVVTLVDLAPTFVSAAQATPTHLMDGRSMLPVIRSNAPGHQTVLIQAGPRGKREMRAGWAFRGVRTSRYTYAWYPNDRFEELYDRLRDPAQEHNVAKSKKYADVLRDLRRRTKVLTKCAGPVCYRSFG